MAFGFNQSAAHKKNVKEVVYTYCVLKQLSSKKKKYRYVAVACHNRSYIINITSFLKAVCLSRR